MGLCYMLGLLVAMITGIGFTLIILAGISVPAILLSIFYRKENKTALLAGLLSVCAGVLWYSVFYYVNVTPVEVLNNETGVVSGSVTETTATDKGYYYYFETNDIQLNNSSVKSVPQRLKLRIRSDSDLCIDRYQKVKFTAEFTEKYKSPYTNHDISNGYYINARLVESSLITYNDYSRPWYSVFTDIKNAVADKCTALLGSEQGGLLISLLLGDKSQLNGSIKDSFRIAGLSHILVVSGLHLTIIMSFIFAFLSLFIKNKKISAGITIGFVVFYTILAGCTYSIMRASVMCIVYLLSFFIMKSPGSLNSLGLAGIVTTALNPLAIGNLGLMLSFSATLGIATLGVRLNAFLTEKLPEFPENIFGKGLNKAVCYVINTTAISLSAAIFTLPVMVFVFQQINIYFLLSNLLISLVAPLVIIVGIVMLALSCVPFLQVLVELVAGIEGFLCSYIIWVTGFVASLPFSAVSVDGTAFRLAMLAVIAVTAVFFVAQGFKIKSAARCAVVNIAVAVMILSGQYAVKSQSISFKIVKSGNGVTMVEDGIDGTNIISCGGSRYYAESTVQDINDNVNSLLIPGYQQYYSCFAQNIVQDLSVKNVCAYSINKYSDDMLLALDNTQCEFVGENTALNYGKYTVQIITTKTRNWLYINCGNENILVTPQGGDCSLLPKEYLNADVVVFQGSCKNAQLLNYDTSVYCGSNKSCYSYCTGGGNVVIYKFADGSFNLWQN